MDYVDRNVPMLARMFERRMRGYRAMGYTISHHDVPERADDDFVVEYDARDQEFLCNGEVDQKVKYDIDSDHHQSVPRGEQDYVVEYDPDDQEYLRRSEDDDFL